jgi:DNA topoisomerase-2
METENIAPRVNSIEDTYQKLDQREHVLKRPDSYVGSVESIRTDMWVYKDEINFETGESTGQGQLEPQKIEYVPALFKIFDEILVNAADNKTRDPENMTWIKVEINQAQGMISVANNGKGIPIRMHQKEKIFVPELIFGNLLTSDNYNDNKKKVTGGRNGFGAKLCNIFSTKFIVETADADVGKKFVQTFSANMTQKTKPKITKYNKKDYTKISFWPDFGKFGMQTLDDDTVALFKKRVYDMAGCTDSSVAVHLNGTKLPVKSFKNYVKLCTKSLEQKFGSSRQIAHLTVNDRWDVAICASDGQFEQVSFVNSIWTCKGGTHVDYISDQVAKSLEKVIASKNKKGTKIKKNAIKQFLCVFVRSLIENPAFDSQTKDALTTQSKAFGSTAVLSAEFLKLLASKKIGIVDKVMALASFKSRKIGKEGTKAKNVRGVAKLDDANKAGTAQSHKCTLILTEGDSAKTLAVSGLSIVGRDYYGVFPLKGKPLNVREARHEQISKNDEIQNIVKIMGLKRNVTYTSENIKTLRYGHLMIMADQDHDGSHIKGLIINFIHWYNPSLLLVPGFLQEFVTPIVKAVKGKKSETFYTIPQYEQWRDTLPEADQKKWKCKYYKGLGTSTAAEAKEYFRDLEKNCIEFQWEDEDEEWIKLAFDKKKATDRKHWIENVHGETYVDYDVDFMRYSDFFNKEFVLYSQASVTRAIPALMDGFKPSQRKVLYACFKRNLKSEIKVAQLAGYVSEHAQYHHGEASLMGAIIGMAQTFVGSNNINLLFPSGQFGTRLMGGSDAASPRYIFTKVCIQPYKNLLILNKNSKLHKMFVFSDCGYYTSHIPCRRRPNS